MLLGCDRLASVDRDWLFTVYSVREGRGGGGGTLGSGESELECVGVLFSDGRV